MSDEGLNGENPEIEFCFRMNPDDPSKTELYGMVRFLEGRRVFEVRIPNARVKREILPLVAKHSESAHGIIQGFILHEVLNPEHERI